MIGFNIGTYWHNIQLKMPFSILNPLRFHSITHYMKNYQS